MVFILQRIDLRDNKLQTAGLLALATALKKNHCVTRIDLDDAPPSQVLSLSFLDTFNSNLIFTFVIFLLFSRIKSNL